MINAMGFLVKKRIHETVSIKNYSFNITGILFIILNKGEKLVL